MSKRNFKYGLALDQQNFAYFRRISRPDHMKRQNSDADMRERTNKRKLARWISIYPPLKYKSPFLPESERNTPEHYRRFSISRFGRTGTLALEAWANRASLCQHTVHNSRVCRHAPFRFPPSILFATLTNELVGEGCNDALLKVAISTSMKLSRIKRTGTLDRSILQFAILVP